MVSPWGQTSSSIGELLIAAPAAAGVIVATGSLLLLALRRKRAPLGWRRPLAALALLGLLTSSTLLGSLRVLKEAIPSTALVVITLVTALLAATLAWFVWKGARCAWWILVALGLAAASLSIAAGVAWFLGDDTASLLIISLTIVVLSVPLFGLSVLLHRDVASDFYREKAEGEMPSEPARGRRISISSWSRLIGAFTFVIALSVACLIGTLLYEESARPAPIGVWITLVLSLLVIPTSASAWRGARWARWTLVIGCVGVLGLSIVGGYLVVTGKEPASICARMGLAALLLFSPLFVLTVLLHPDVVEEFRQRRRMTQDASSKTRLSARMILAGVVVFLALLLIFAFQHGRFAAERRRLEMRTEILRNEIRQAEVTASKLQEFHKEVALLEARLETLKQILPSSLEEALFIENKLQKLARELGIVIESWTSSRAQRDFYESAEIKLRLKGKPKAIDRLAVRVEQMRRLAVWRKRKDDSSGADVTITIYAFKELVPKLMSDHCTELKSRVWLWPYTIDIHERVEKTDILCRRLADLRAIRDQIHRFQVQRQMFRRLVDLIEHLRRKQATYDGLPTS